MPVLSGQVGMVDSVKVKLIARGMRAWQSVCSTMNSVLLSGLRNHSCLCALSGHKPFCLFNHELSTVTSPLLLMQLASLYLSYELLHPWHMYSIVAILTPPCSFYLKLRISLLMESVRSVLPFFVQLQKACDCLNRLVYAQPTFRPCLETESSVDGIAERERKRSSSERRLHLA